MHHAGGFMPARLNRHVIAATLWTSYKGGRMARENLDALINEIKARMKTIRDSL